VLGVIKGAQEPREWGKWPKIKPESVAPLRDGIPNMYDHVPTRFVSKNEATARGWKHFWTGDVCVTGHRAARYIANPSVCVDCQRIQKGKLPVYGKGIPELEAARVARTYTQKHTAHAATPPTPNAAEKNFLSKYADLKDFALAAEACGRTEAEFLAILSWNATFREAVNRLEESIGVTRTQKVTEYFDWDDDKRRSFLLTYANTADMKQSLRSVGATNVQFHRELTDNEEFHRQFDEAHEISKSVFDHAASASAIKGDSRMLGRVAANLFPEKYGESMKMDLNVKQNLSVEQAHAALTSLVQRFDKQGLLSAPDGEEEPIIDAEYQGDGPTAGDADDQDPGTESESAGSDPNSDLVSGSE
jgi:hypothetical protein